MRAGACASEAVELEDVYYARSRNTTHENDDTQLERLAIWAVYIGADAAAAIGYGYGRPWRRLVASTVW